MFINATGDRFFMDQVEPDEATDRVEVNTGIREIENYVLLVGISSQCQRIQLGRTSVYLKKNKGR